MAGRDRLEGHGHADDVGAEGAQHADLGRRLELGPGHLGVDAGGQGGDAGGGQRLPRAAPGAYAPTMSTNSGPLKGERPVRLRWSDTAITDPVTRSSRMPPTAAVRITVEQPAAIPVRRGWTTSLRSMPS